MRQSSEDGRISRGVQEPVRSSNHVGISFLVTVKTATRARYLKNSASIVVTVNVAHIMRRVSLCECVRVCACSSDV